MTLVKTKSQVIRPALGLNLGRGSMYAPEAWPHGGLSMHRQMQLRSFDRGSGCQERHSRWPGVSDPEHVLPVEGGAKPCAALQRL